MNKPNLFRRTIMFLLNTWRSVMDVKYNPLKYVPDPSLQAYFMLILFSIWCVFFGLITIYYLGFINYSIIASLVIHGSILIPMMITNAVFIDAERDGEQWLKEWQEEEYKYKVFLRRIKMQNLVRWNRNNNR
ncbi:MAG: hypothetical protein HOH08_00425 [Gammaproteobacteria bacterium]|jgi:hypothetical protein|nr:hypothetical protein [Gammaproteobacteria bacterium]MBT5216621.1 hypothetical protein [Gammaproteobacteria bacterium]MBT6073395.1 hypothetical protein [Gammaproteobacteria bacterium]